MPMKEYAIVTDPPPPVGRIMTRTDGTREIVIYTEPDERAGWARVWTVILGARPPLRINPEAESIIRLLEHLERMEGIYGPGPSTHQWAAYAKHADLAEGTHTVYQVCLECDRKREVVYKYGR